MTLDSDYRQRSSQYDSTVVNYDHRVLYKICHGSQTHGWHRFGGSHNELQNCWISIGRFV